VRARAGGVRSEYMELRKAGALARGGVAGFSNRKRPVTALNGFDLNLHFPSLPAKKSAFAFLQKIFGLNLHSESKTLRHGASSLRGASRRA